MNDIDRNARTLIICFVLAIVSLTVLRFVEIGQGVVMVSDTQILGVQDKKIVLPNAEIKTEVLQARYIGK